jgi:hypothetical protein
MARWTAPNRLRDMGVARKYLKNRAFVPCSGTRGMPVENPLVFYPRRVLEVARSTRHWVTRFQKYRKMRKRITADPANWHYMDEALAPITADATQDHLVQAFADQIPNTYGAPKEHAATARVADAIA